MQKYSLLFLTLLAFACQRQEKKSEKDTPDKSLKPKLAMSNVNITNISDDAIHMNVMLLIDNPLPVSFSAKKLNYTLSIAGQEVMKDAYQKPITVKSGDSTVVTLPAKLMAEKLTHVLKGLEAKGIDSTDYQLKSSFELDVPILGERTFTVTSTKKLPTFYIPKIKVEDLDLGHIGLKHTDLAAKVSIQNKNKFPFTFTDTHYTIKINGKLIADGDQKEPILIKKQATTPVVFPVTMKPGQALSLLPKALFDKKDTHYEIDFRAKILEKEGNALIKNSKIAAKITGTLDDIKKIAKK